MEGEIAIGRRSRSGRRGLVWTGAPALLDHGAIAAAHFGANVALARWLEPGAYGAFALAHSLYLIADALQHALLAEPILVFSGRLSAQQRREYVGTALWGFAALAAFAAAALGLGALGLAWSGRPGPAVALAAFAVAAPVLLASVLLRRMCYARGSPGDAATAGMLYAAVTGTGFAALALGSSVSVPAAVGILGLASLASVGWTASRPGLAPGVRPSRASLRAFAAEHWRYGRWSTLASLAKWVPWNLHYVLLAAPLGLASIAGIRALTNLVAPVRLLASSMAMSMIPFVSAQLASPRPAGARATLARLAGIYGAASLAYAGAMWAFGRPLLGSLFGEAYASVYFLAFWTALVQLPAGAIAVVGIGLRAAGRSDRALIPHGLYALLGLALGGAGGLAWGPAGLVFGMLAAAFLAFGIALRELHRLSPWSMREAPGAAGTSASGSDRETP